MNRNNIKNGKSEQRNASKAKDRAVQQPLEHKPLSWLVRHGDQAPQSGRDEVWHRKMDAAIQISGSSFQKYYVVLSLIAEDYGPTEPCGDAWAAC